MPEFKLAGVKVAATTTQTSIQLNNAGLTPHTGDVVGIPERPRAVKLPPLLVVVPPSPTFPISDPSGTAPHTGPVLTTPELKQQAQSQMAKDTVHSAFMFTAIAEIAGRAVFPRNPHAAEVLAKDVAGFELKPVPGTNRARPSLGRVSLLGIGPAPLGYVPPEVYGLQPDFLLQNEKKKTPEHQRTIGIEIIGALGGNPGGARQAFADAQTADAAAAAFRGRVGRLNDAALQDAFLNPTIAVAGTSPTKVRPAEIRDIAAQELLRRGLTVPSLPGIIAGAPADGTIQPSLIQPVSAAALANMDAAEGIRKELVAERADP